MSPAAPVAVTVVVLAEGGPEETARCLASVERGQLLPDEVVVVDASRAEGALTASLPAGCRRVRATPGAGRAAALTAGAAAASGTVLVFLRAEAEVEPGWLPPLLAAAAGASPAVAGSRLSLADGSVVDGLLLAYGRPFPLSPICQLDTSAISGHRAPLPVPAVSGVCLAIPAALLARLGGFDAAFTAGGEDVDLCLRASEAGVPVLVARASRVHHRGHSLTQRPGLGGEPLLAARWLGRVPLLDVEQIHAPSSNRPGLPRAAVTVVVPLSAAPQVATQCLEALLRGLSQGDELVMVDPGGACGLGPLARVLAAEAPQERRVVEAAEDNLADAARIGLAAASHPVVALLQPTPSLPDGLVDELAGLLREHGELDLVAFPAPPMGLVAAGRRAAMQRLGAEVPQVFFTADVGLLQAAASERGLRVAALG